MAPYGFGGRHAARRRRGSGGTPAPTPTPTPGLPQAAAIVAHWNASDIPPQADNTTIAAWTDSSGSAITASVPSGQTAPRYRASGAGGKAAVQFTGGSGGVGTILSIPTPGALKTAIDTLEYTVLIVVDQIVSASTASVFGTAHGGDTLHMYADGSNVGRFTLGLLSAVPFTGSGYVSFGAGVTKSSTAGGSGGGHLQRFFARGAVFSSAVAAGQGTANKTLCIGGGAIDATPTFFFRGWVYRIVVWNRLLTPAEVQQAEAYFNGFYGQTHPAATAGKMLHIDGDSRHAGIGASGPSISGAVGYKIAQGLSLPLGAWSNYAIGGLTIQSCINKGAEIDAAAATLPGIAHRLLYEESFNSRSLSLGTPSSAGTFVYQTKQYVDARRAGLPAGTKIVGCSPVDHANVNTPAWGAHGWAAYAQANWAALGFDGLADLWASELGGDGAFTVSPYNTASGTTGGDGIHLSALGQTIQADVEVAACLAVSGF